ncbi:MAG: hypothetical protein MI919_12910 [Holophagales bacterium]|nr:hypothetical protein [Holophagales bacterium]
MSRTFRRHTFFRRVLPALALVLALAALVAAWPAATVADPAHSSPDLSCQNQCSIDALACSIGCWEKYRNDPVLGIQCQIACEQTLDACVAACP